MRAPRKIIETTNFASFTGFNGGARLPVVWSIYDTDDGGFVSVAAALCLETTGIPKAGAMKSAEKPNHLFLSIAEVSPDGISTMYESLSEAGIAIDLPRPLQLAAMAQALIGHGKPAPVFGNMLLDWKRIMKSRTIFDFTVAGLIDIPVGSGLTIAGDPADAIRDRFRKLENTDGSLSSRLDRHHPDVPHILALLSTIRSSTLPFVEARPWILDSWYLHWHYDHSTAEGFTPDKLADILNDLVPAKMLVSPAAVRWCDRFFSEHAMDAPDIAFMILLSTLPRSWWPKEAEDYVVLRKIAPTLLNLCDMDENEAVDMLRPAKGRFAEYFAALGKEILSAFVGGEFNQMGLLADTPALRIDCFTRVNMALADCDDLVMSVYRNLVLPFRGPNLPTGTFEVARRIISRGGGIRRYIEASRRWHAMPAMQGKLNTDDHVWPSFVDPFEHDGVEVIELCRAKDLWEEGDRMEHCVGGDNYVESCMQGTSRIISLRVDGKSISTAEYRPFGGLDAPGVIQHRGYGNAIPPARAKAALDAWLVAIETGLLDIRPVEPVDMPEIYNDELSGDGPSSWRPFIRRDLASMTWEEFGEEVRRMALDTCVLPENDDGYEQGTPAP